MRAGTGTVIRAILALQIGIGGVLVASDVSHGWQGFGFGRKPPAMDRPVTPGDQRRRYSPDHLPAEAPNRSFPATGDMPPRLRIDEVVYEGEAALRLVGTISPGDGARIGEDLARRHTLPPVLLHSPGGSVKDALELGRFLRDVSARIIVVAGDVCLSACPYLLAGGAERHVEEDASVGVHQHYFGQNSVQPAFMAVEDIQRGQGMVMEYLIEMGVDPRLMQPALMTPPDEIYILLPDELSDYGLVTAPETA